MLYPPCISTTCSVTTTTMSASTHQGTAHQLETKLAHRPEKAELVERNILKDDRGLAPALVAAKEKLQKARLEDQLANAIAHRPDREQLEKTGILKDSIQGEEAPASA
ncbi:unnamed protein product [Mycena citricolor]|uniref:RPEL repeat protein n=1 Tax=Mycena citricolor TaxID=2018698 RepID=A0AAD2HWG6_9AGAR|nr:unnamed protein product [Mycena citricolor]